jgi:two-component system, OmpR family, response regulator
MLRMNVLVVEDDVRLAHVIRRGLAKNGHIVDMVHDGGTAEYLATENAYDAIVLDVMLPGIDGYSLTRSLRHQGVQTPILMLSARDTVQDTITGLDAGANDFVRKPFVFAELCARLRSVARQPSKGKTAELAAADVRLDLATRAVTRCGRGISLTARETAFLEYFMRHAGQIVTRGMLEGALWEHGRYVESNVVEVYVSRLRNKLHLDGMPAPIVTIRGMGYRFS